MILDDDLTEEELEQLANEGSVQQRRAAAKHPNASIWTLLTLAKMGFFDEVDQNPLLPLHVETGSSEAIQIVWLIAENTKRPERLEELASSPWVHVRRAVAVNESSPISAFLSLAMDSNADLRCAMARKNVHPSVLTILSKDEDHSVRREVATNPNLTSEHIAALAKDESSDVRYQLAQANTISQDTLVFLAKDPELYVRWRVAYNQNTPLDTLKMLVHDEHHYVREAAKFRLEKLNKVTQ
jgi:hypothetical protein